jgi:hypothetical protein
MIMMMMMMMMMIVIAWTKCIMLPWFVRQSLGVHLRCVVVAVVVVSIARTA